MPPKLKTPAPIDRPLSRAYLRQFTGWSCAHPPGQSEPNSLREMENMFVDRNGALSVRPGLRYLSYLVSPDQDPLTPAVEGTALDRPMVGTQEPFYTKNGDKALLFAVRETDGTVGFRALLFTDSETVVKMLTDPLIGFIVPQGEAMIRFTAATTHVEYLQIDNKILAMSDAGETARLFFVGAEKLVRRMGAISMPYWEDAHKLKVVHPDSAWVLNQPYTLRRNSVVNPSFEAGLEFWHKGALSDVRVVPSGVGINYAVSMKSLPTRTNIQTSPLHNVASTGTVGWAPHPDWGNPKLTKDGAFMKVYEASQKMTFLAYGARLTVATKVGDASGQKFRVAVDYEIGTHVEPITVLTFYNASGAKIGKSTSLAMPRKNGRYSSPAVTAPTGTVTMRVSLGGRNEKASSTFVKFKNVVLCKDGESTAMFSGSSGTNYFWTGAVNASASIYHPPADVSITCDRVPIHAGAALSASVYAVGTAAKSWTMRLRTFTQDTAERNRYDATGALPAGSALGRPAVGTTTTAVDAVTADMTLIIHALARNELVYVDNALLEYGTATAGSYFDGGTPATPTVTNQWADKTLPHRTFSVQTIKNATPTVPVAETPTAKTLIASGGPTANPYKMGFFYTFENDMGESAASKITEVRISRPWSNWVWETPNALGEPSGVETQTADLCADQLVAIVPQAVFDRAVAEGALKWNLYVLAWSDQEPVPVVAQLVTTRDLYADQLTRAIQPMVNYVDQGWIAVTPARKVGLNDSVLPTRENRVNYSKVPRTRNGLVAGDRLIVIGDPNELATIRWSSNRPGEYTNFTANRGGGAKTLTSGNLNVPSAVVLWQNPQSIDTLTVLCQSSDGQSVSYYMMPATVAAQTGTTSIMGFEETTSTPGTAAPYAVEVLNNALYRPTDRSLLKSTAQNYNITHKTMSDKIANMWWRVNSKNWMMSAQLDNRLYYLVHNPAGEVLEPNCKGNEIWVYDVSGGEAGTWARLLIQGSALRVFSLGDREYLGITRPGGMFYLDPDSRLDDYVGTDGKVRSRPIPWRFETNTQGANRAHDAWAHLQFIQVTLGNFTGTMRYGIRGQDVNHQPVEVVKEFTDLGQVVEDGGTWDVDDMLQVRRDMKEWFLFGSSVDGKESSGHLGYVQYRYTPVTVNVGYEYGSLETFDYGSNVTDGANAYSDNGIPLPVIDYSRP